MGDKTPNTGGGRIGKVYQHDRCDPGIIIQYLNAAGREVEARELIYKLSSDGYNPVRIDESLRGLVTAGRVQIKNGIVVLVK